MSEKTEFEKAFAAARKAGKKTFTFKGKSYNTKRKDEQSKITIGKIRVKEEDSWLEKLHKKMFPSKYKDTEENRKKRAETMKKVEANKKKRKGSSVTIKGVRVEKKKMGGFRNTSGDWIESGAVSLDD